MADLNVTASSAPETPADDVSAVLEVPIVVAADAGNFEASGGNGLCRSVFCIFDSSLFELIYVFACFDVLFVSI